MPTLQEPGEGVGGGQLLGDVIVDRSSLLCLGLSCLRLGEIDLE